MKNRRSRVNMNTMGRKRSPESIACIVSGECRDQAMVLTILPHMVWLIEQQDFRTISSTIGASVMSQDMITQLS